MAAELGLPACAADLTGVKETTIPDPALVAAYAKKYEIWRKLYPALKGVLTQ